MVIYITIVNSAVLKSDENNSIGLEVKSLIVKLSGESENLTFILILLNAIKEQAFTKTITFKKRGYLKKDTTELLDFTISETEKFMNELSVFEITGESFRD